MTHQRQAFILTGVVSEDATKRNAEQRFHASGERTRIHYHPATTEDCNARCTEWPLASNDKSSH